MKKYVVTKRARKHIDEIWWYIAQDNLHAAEGWVETLEQTFERLGQAPGIGRVRIDLMPIPVQIWPFGAYLVLYRTTRRGVEIVGVVHGSRNWPKLAGRHLL